MGALRTIWYRLEEGVIALLLAFMTILTFIQVLLRYGWGTGILWGQEAVLYAFAWLVLFGLAYGFRTRAHLGIDIIVKMMPAPAQRVVGLTAIACCALFAGLMLWGSYVYIAKLYEVGVEAQDMPIERWLLGAIMPFGFALLLVRFATEAWLILSGRAAGFELADEAGDVLRDREVAAPRE